jgi:hypothetical protein
MDAGRTTRKYPSYTTAQLESFITEGVTEFRSAEKVADIAAEVANRKVGASRQFAIPQIEGGQLVFKIGRM